MDILCSCRNISLSESEYKNINAILMCLKICQLVDIHSLTLYIFPFSIQSPNALKFLLGGINLIHYLFPLLRTFEGHQLLSSFY